MQKTADLHFHTTYSDGKHSIDWVISKLKEAHSDANLGLAVLTDHDGIAGFREFREAIKDFWTPICASELSCTFQADPDGKHIELHLLVYGMDPSDPYLQTNFARFRLERETRFFKICERLTEAGYPLDAKAIAKKHSGVLGRPHIADALVEAGFASSRADAFDRFLFEGSRYNVSKWRFPLEEAVREAKRAGWKTSVAHPGQYGFKEPLIQKFKDVGVDALEIYHPRHTGSDRAYYGGLAKKVGFKISGGSDFHAAETDLIEGLPSLGRTQYPESEARRFLGELL